MQNEPFEKHEAKIIQLGKLEKPKAKPYLKRGEFVIRKFDDGRQESYRVYGVKLNGERVRKNFKELHDARAHQVELLQEAMGVVTETKFLATTLTAEQKNVAETISMVIPDPTEQLAALQLWKEKKAKSLKKQAPLLSKASQQFAEWVDSEAKHLRVDTRRNLKSRISLFVKNVHDQAVSEITHDCVDNYLDERRVSETTKDNDRRCISRFFSWMMDRPRRWVESNPARKPRGKRSNTEDSPEILTVEQAGKILREAEKFKAGRLVPYVVLGLFGGLRPFEILRLTWKQINLADSEIRLEGWQSKTGRPRTVKMPETLKVWLAEYEAAPIRLPNFRRDFDHIKAMAGFGNPENWGEEARKRYGELKPWVEDVIRHTAISHFFRDCHSYGRTAEWAGNSEQMIKLHYQGRVSSEETKQFYAMLPLSGVESYDYGVTDALKDLTREQLYELVWTTPAIKIAADYGISDAAVIKRCKKLHIPRPGIGYWAKVKQGQQKPERAPLPPA